MHILVLNAGSSSLKYKLFNMAGTPRALAHGQAERIGQADASISHHWHLDSPEPAAHAETLPISSQHDALDLIVRHLEEHAVVRDAHDIAGVGQRVVHGGDRFSQPVRIDESVLSAIYDTISLAPLHNPANLEGIETARKRWPGLAQVAVFDTAFHQTMPPEAYRYALPTQLYTDYKVRRYGFHGTSHHFVGKAAARWLGKPFNEVNLISLHLGNGCSAAAIRGGASVDTSMGLTPLEGLVMGTRSGNIDPSLPFFLAREGQMNSGEIEFMLNQESGLKGICGLSDMRAIHQSGSDEARLAEKIFAYAVKKYIGAYYAVLGHLDAVLFTGGIGEHAAFIRQQVCTGLEGLGLVLDPTANAAPGNGCRAISTATSPVSILVVPTDEELEIARSTAALIGQ
ncbi:acetate/propionate family kinase [Acidihalobacter ferrooxydans]|uniref:Acetate kinase n=1 Tax=Acidihalobacter ferrooxydans TaxID=1765967 RepID=A0A1P8UD32_9GAMM|nr:acetate kinase [Acidihalobacter ferrooxydans]APZ41765.1 acetate kinase [Acidihalobacter ferrooxydans]